MVSKERNMIIVKLQGGLGNQLFQYAFGRLLSIKNNAEVKYFFEETQKHDTNREYKLGYFHTKVILATPKEIESARYPLGKYFGIVSKLYKKIFKQYNIGYVPTMLSQKNGLCEGYWQSYKYLDPIREKLLEELTLKNPIDTKFSEVIEKMKNTNSVSVHVRRGDYVDDAKTKSEHYTFGLEYYEKAFSILQKKIESPVLFIFSDDIDWAKENIKSDIKMNFVSNPMIQDYEELVLMSQCKHNIIANSTFSFWAAWLNQSPLKIVIAPQKWNNQYTKEYKDLLPEGWITI